MLTNAVLRLLAGPPEWVTLGALRWEVRFDHLTLLRLQDATGVDVLAGKLSVYQPDSRILRDLIQVTLWEGGPVDWTKLTPPVARRLLDVFRRAWIRDMPVRDSSPSATGGGGGGATTETWMEAWANARQILNLSDEEWLSYTPRMTQTLSRLRLESVRQNEWMLAQISASVVNWSMQAPKPAAKIDVFMLHPWNPSPDPKGIKEAPQTAETVLRMFRNFSGMDEAGKQAIDQLVN